MGQAQQFWLERSVHKALLRFTQGCQCKPEPTSLKTMSATGLDLDIFLWRPYGQAGIYFLFTFLELSCVCWCEHLLEPIIECWEMGAFPSFGIVWRCKGEGRGQRLCWCRVGPSELVRCHIRSPGCLIPAIVKASALSRFGMTVKTRGSC